MERARLFLLRAIVEGESEKISRSGAVIGYCYEQFLLPCGC